MSRDVVLDMAKSTIERISIVFRAMVDALCGKVDDPQAMLEEAYQALQDRLIKLRKDFAKASSEVQKLKAQIRTANERGESVSDLEQELTIKATAIEKMRTQLEELEDEVQRSYTKKQVLAVRDSLRPPRMDSQPAEFSDPKPYLLTGGAVVVVWYLLAMLLAQVN